MSACRVDVATHGWRDLTVALAYALGLEGAAVVERLGVLR
jgi:hypothetical protein